MSFLIDESGATAIEYGFFAGLFLICFFVSIAFVFGNISNAANVLVEALTIA
tara:strand:+ start:344 stop:499 length:156 start_codon:yes stop_codon:yes gene_type:complete